MAGESVVIEYVGGPADSTQQHVMVDTDGFPPVSIRIFGSPHPLQPVPNPDEPIKVPVYVYDRHPSPLDDGPLWHYRYREDS